MDNFYYETTVSVSAFKNEIENFLMERFYNGIEEKNSELILRSEEPLEDLINDLDRYVRDLEKIFKTQIKLNVKTEKKSNKDWIKTYQDSVKPVEVDGFYVHPSWYPPKDGKINVLIDPALAFGSGHHETTRSCLKAIKKYVKKGDMLLDVGCGSGILSIAAAKLGAVVDACDTDELAVKSAKENFESNGVKYGAIWCGSAKDTDKTYDVVIANIIADVLIFIAGELKEKCGNYLILSGILDKYKQRVLKKYPEFEKVEEILQNEWVTLVLKRK